VVKIGFMHKEATKADGKRRELIMPTGDDPNVIILAEPTLRDDLARLRSRLEGVLAAGRSPVIIDVSGLECPSSTTVAAMLWAKRRCSARRVGLVLRNPSHRSRSVLRRTGLDTCVEPRAPVAVTT
jgi:anti-anti-sigma regulatory factor